MITFKLLTISADEENEFLDIIGRESKWGKRLRTQCDIPHCGHQKVEIVPYYHCNPVCHNPEVMPEPSHVGRRVRWYVSGPETPVYATGTVHRHYISGDDCSGYWGRQCYQVRQDKNGELLSPLGPDVCEFIDGPTPVYFPYRWTMGAGNPRPDWIGRKVRISNKYAHGSAGHNLVVGQTGTIAEIGPITCAWAFWVTPTGGGQNFSANPTDCEFIDVI